MNLHIDVNGGRAFLGSLESPLLPAAITADLTNAKELAKLREAYITRQVEGDAAWAAYQAAARISIDSPETDAEKPEKRRLMLVAAQLVDKAGAASKRALLALKLAEDASASEVVVLATAATLDADARARSAFRALTSALADRESSGRLALIRTDGYRKNPAFILHMDYKDHLSAVGIAVLMGLTPLHH